MSPSLCNAREVLKPTFGLKSSSTTVEKKPVYSFVLQVIQSLIILMHLLTEHEVEFY